VVQHNILEEAKMAEILGYDMPDDLHAWARVEDDGMVRIGMNDFYQKLAGETTYADLPFEGDEVEQGETAGKIQSSKWVGKFCSPVSGEIIEINSKLEDDPTLINSDPYGEGWIMKVKPSNLDEELKGLIKGSDVDAVKKWLEVEKREKVDKE
jgi:glycine cleavage system H protein